jgi:hypothetical protein
MRPRLWAERPRRSAIRFHEDLIQVYRSMKEHQREIDLAFASVASRIDFGATTTFPVRAEVESWGILRSLDPDGDSAGLAVLGREFKPFLEALNGRTLRGVAPGTWHFYLIWHDALLLELKCDVYAPVQMLPALIDMLTAPAEPARFASPLPEGDTLTISAINAAYPELHLADRMSAKRTSGRRIASQAMEPAPPSDSLLAELQTVLQDFGM